MSCLNRVPDPEDLSDMHLRDEEQAAFEAHLMAGPDVADDADDYDPDLPQKVKEQQRILTVED